MASTLLYQNAQSVITFSPDCQQLYLKWTHQPSQEELISVYERAIAFAKSTQARSLVVDNTIGFTVTLSMQRTLAALAISHLNQVAVRRFARVTPPDVFQEIVTHKVLDQINALSKKPIEVAYFHRTEDAIAWAALPPVGDVSEICS